MVNVPIIDMAATGKRIAALRDAAGLTVRDGKTLRLWSGKQN